MLTITRTLVYEPFIFDAIEGCRLSYGSSDKMDSHLVASGTLTIGPIDRAFCEARLRTHARGEDKFLRTISVSCWLRAPLRWCLELDTYKIGTVRQSSSLMHRMSRDGPLTADDFTATTDPRLIDLANEKYDAWVQSGAKRNFTSRAWLEFQDAIGRGYFYTSHCAANYAVLRNVYAQRAHHRMGEWRTFCAWVDALPHSWLITYTGDKR